MKEANKGENSHFYIDGRCSKTYYCIDCGNEISMVCALYEGGRCDSCCRKGERNPNFGKRGKETSSYIHGKGYEPYSPKFTKQLKETIHKRDNYQCQRCGMTQREHFIVYNKNIEVHHIDYDKDNLNKDNLITACKKCNIRANFDRDYWYAYFTYIMEERRIKL